MKAITLPQPWATLVAAGYKRIITHDVGTDHRGPIAIHASSSLDAVEGRGGLVELCSRAPWSSFVVRSCRDPLEEVLAEQPPRLVDTAGSWALAAAIERLPLGAVVGVARLVRVDQFPRDYHPGDPEEAFGDFSAGRFGWLLSAVQQIRPMSWKGRLGLWDLPDDVLDGAGYGVAL